jgi:polygalacturonase
MKMAPPSRLSFVLLISAACVLSHAATAIAQSYSLTINTLGAGSVSANPTGPYVAGTVVTLTETPDPGWSFSSWSGDLSGYANPTTLVINGNYTVTATFDSIGYAGITGDSRSVTEPVFPAVCTVLLAQQSSGTLDQNFFDTTRLQAAIDNCPMGQAVELSASGAKDAFLTKPMVLKPGTALLIDAEVTLFGSNNKADYSCDTSCAPLIQVAANTSPNPGSGIMGYGVIDGQGSAFWGSDPRPRLIYVGDPASHASSDNFIAYKISLQNSPQFNLYAISNGLTIWGVKIRNPGNSPNTDGIDPSGATNVTIRDSYISTGDDHIAIKAGIGHVSNVTIAHNHLYYGHGLSMGSETNAGIENVLATDNVIDQNGCVGCTSSNDIRIKSDVSRGGEVKNILYQDTCIRNATKQSHEFVFNPFYTSTSGSLIPNFHHIYMHNLHLLDAGGVSTFQGYDSSHLLTMFMDNVVWDGYNSNDFTSSYTSNAEFALGTEPVSFAAALSSSAPSDTNVTVRNNISGTAPPYDCTGRFSYLAGELFTRTPTAAPGSSATIVSVLQPAIYGSAAPTGTIQILEGSTVVASASLSGRVTPLTIPSVSPGAHIYTASYSGDANYGQLRYGRATITATGSGSPAPTDGSAPLADGGNAGQPATEKRGCGCGAGPSSVVSLAGFALLVTSLLSNPRFGRAWRCPAAGRRKRSRTSRQWQTRRSRRC